MLDLALLAIPLIPLIHIPITGLVKATAASASDWPYNKPINRLPTYSWKLYQLFTDMGAYLGVVGGRARVARRRQRPIDDISSAFTPTCSVRIEEGDSLLRKVGCKEVIRPLPGSGLKSIDTCRSNARMVFFLKAYRSFSACFCSTDK